MSELGLRAPRFEDIDRLAEVHVRSWQVGYRDLLPADFLASLDPQWRARQRREAWNHPDYAHVRGLLAERDGEVVGFVHYGPYRDSHQGGWTATDPAAGGQVYALYVHPDAWGRGAGSRLLRAAVADLVASGLTPVRVWTLCGNTQAIRFYQRHGFRPDGIRQPIPLGPDGSVVLPAERFTLRDGAAGNRAPGPA